MKILILGATGKIGTEVTRQLLTKNVRPTVGVRNIKKAKALFGDQVDYRLFDFDEFDTFTPTLSGISHLFFIAGHSNPVPSVQQLLRQAQEVGVQHITFSSGRTTGDIVGKPLFEVENLVRAHPIPYTILRPGWFMQNFCNWLGTDIKSKGQLIVPADDSKTAFIDLRDIAAVAVKTLTEKGHDNKMYELTSDEAIDHGQVAQIISKSAGISVEYRSPSHEDYVKGIVAQGGSKEGAEYAAKLFDIVKTGKEAKVSPDVEKVLHRLPISFEEFAEDYADTWKS